MTSPRWISSPTLEGPCKSHLAVSWVFLIFFLRWGTRYDHGNSRIRDSLLDFAVEKLLCADPHPESLTPAQTYAVLSQRLALDINTPQYLFASTSPLETMYKMHEQVANHMRVCVAVGDGVESLRAIASSEPILSEAASQIMRHVPTFSLPGALSTILSGFCINQGDRGELLVAAFFTWARDQAVREISDDNLCHYFSVEYLLKHLFSETTFNSMSAHMPSLCHSKDAQQPFSEVLKKTNMHFNHFIKPQKRQLLARQYLTLYMARGAAALGANCQPGFDAVYPYLYDTIKFDPKKVGFVIVQVKNDSNPSRSTADDIFSAMDPFTCGLLDNSDLEDGIFPIPIIRFVFSLSHGTPEVTRREPNMGSMSQKFTSYDYLCKGVSADILRPVGQSPEGWAALVNKSDPWDSFYNVTVPDVLRAQLPGCGTAEGHWDHWVKSGFIW